MTETAIFERLAGPDGRYAYQVPSARALAAALETHRGSLDASGMGVGKTATNMAAALLSGRPFGVICPKPCVAGWQRCADMFGAQPLFIAGYEEMKRGSKFFRLDKVTKGGRRAGRWTLPSGATLLFDEAQNCGGGLETQNGELLASAWRSGCRVAMITATLADSPANMWATGQVLGLHSGEIDQYEEWLISMGCRWNDERMRWDFHSSQRHKLESIRSHIFDGQTPRGVIVTVEDLGKAFPESDVKAIAVELPDEVKSRIDRSWSETYELVRRISAQRQAPYVVARLLTQAWAKAYSLSQQAKVPYLLERIPAGIAQGWSIPVFCTYTETRESLMSGMRSRCGIFGGQKPDERERHRLDFQQDRERAIYCQIQSGGTGLDLHDVESAYPRFSFIMPMPKWKLVEQATGRVRRAGGGPSKQRILFAAGTVEEKMCAKNQERLANMRAMMGKGRLFELEKDDA